jgi:PIN domain nuclease of toxin-antitoxin system
MNRLLLDTCVFLWWQVDDSRIGADARRLIRQADEVFVSVATAWEIAIKVGLGKVTVPEPVSAALQKSSLIELPIRIPHAEAAGALPLHHRDPFDRLLVAQAQVEQLVLATSDAKLRPYDVTCFWL